MSKGDRVRQARELRGLTQTDLAKRIGTNQSTIAHIESSRFQPADSMLSAIALQTGFPPRFFGRNAPPDFSPGSMEFRAKAKASAKEKTQAYRLAQIAFELFEFLSERVKQVPVRLPSIHESDPEKAAELMRAALSLPLDQPIPNVTRLLERHGVLILQLPINFPNQDAFCLWAGADQYRPVIALSMGKTGDRVRFNVPHELRHLIFPANGSVDDIEKDANRFAGAFLVPGGPLREELADSPVTLSTLVPLKKRWGVALQVLIRRSHEVGLVNQRQYYYLMEQVGRRGWRKREPEGLDLPVERPRVLRQMAEVAYGIPIDHKKLATDSSLPVRLVQAILEAHAGRSVTPRPQDARKKRGVVLLRTR